MKAQPGYISTQLHKGIAGSGTFVNYAIWQDVESFRRAFTSPEFQSRIANYPDCAVTRPHLFRSLAVPNHCVRVTFDMSAKSPDWTGTARPSIAGDHCRAVNGSASRAHGA